MNENTTGATKKRSGLVLGIMMAVIVVGCSGGAETGTTGASDTGVDTESTMADVVDTTTTGASTATGDPVASDQDPCTILTIDEINQVFPGNDEPWAAEDQQCLFDGFFIDLQPLTLEMIEDQEEPTGWEVRPLEIEGADWAVFRIDTNVTDYEKVLDVIAGGPTGTVHIIVQNADIELGSATFEGVVGLLQTAMGRL